jgi:ubiquinol-cytochrome c reductase cytochrome b subunit
MSGLYYLIILKENLAYFGNNLAILLAACKYFISFLMINKVKMLYVKSQSAGVCSSKETAPQRLNAGEQAWLVGLYEADGWFGVFKNGKYVQYEFGIELHKRDIPLLYKIKNILQVSGTVRLRNDRPNVVVLKVRNKKDLREKIFPIFDRFSILTVKQEQFNFFKFNLIDNNTIYFVDIKRPIYNHNLLTVDQILKLPYFNAWLVGFIEGEGCFSCYQAKKDINITCSFSISQTGSIWVLQAIRKLFNLRPAIFTDLKTHNSELKTASVSGNANVLDFLHKNPVKLKGYKRIQYILWAKNMRTNPRYSNVNVPTNL